MQKAPNTTLLDVLVQSRRHASPVATLIYILNALGPAPLSAVVTRRR